MTIIKNFDEFNNDLGKQFLKNGYIVNPVENIDGLNEIKKNIIGDVCKFTGLDKNKDEDKFLNTFHLKINQNKINDVRMNLYANFNNQNWFRPTYFSFGKSLIETVIGNELVMQNKINISIMMPNDSSSNIPIHLDPHSGESPYQCVMWIPLTNVYKTKSIFILPPEVNKKILVDFKKLMEEGGRERVFEEIKSELIWVDINYGSLLLFSPNLIHGSVKNETDETRWSFNTRFKSLFSPYISQEKGLGSFYLPISVRPATIKGMEYKIPKDFNDK
tara:strand:- start:8195 stop:9019 length:825 start_codon:yes stop_codon:yes gene_type:complete